MVGCIKDRLVLNPTLEQIKYSRLNLAVAGTKDAAVLMIKGAEDFLQELLLMVKVVGCGHKAIQI